MVVQQLGWLSTKQTYGLGVCSSAASPALLWRYEEVRGEKYSIRFLVNGGYLTMLQQVNLFLV